MSAAAPGDRPRPERACARGVPPWALGVFARLGSRQARQAVEGLGTRGWANAKKYGPQKAMGQGPGPSKREVEEVTKPLPDRV